MTGMERHRLALNRVAGLTLAALVLFLGAEIVLLFVLTPSHEVLAWAGPVCHYGIIASLLIAALVTVTRLLLMRERDGAR